MAMSYHAVKAINPHSIILYGFIPYFVQCEHNSQTYNFYGPSLPVLGYWNPIHITDCLFNHSRCLI